MSQHRHKPKNRFLPGAHASELTLVGVLFCWLNGSLYSEMPDAIRQEGGEVDAAVEELIRLMGERFHLAGTPRQGVSRQACHSIITEVSLQVIARSYKDRIAHLEQLLESGDPSMDMDRKRVLAFLDRTPSIGEKADLLAHAQNTSVRQFIQRWGTIVYMLSANKVPYEAIRSIDRIKPFDVIQNPVILAKMQERFRRFRGYKIDALKPHIAHYFCLRQGADFLLRDEGAPNYETLHRASERERSKFWKKCVMRSLAVLLLELQSGMTYLQLRDELWRDG